MDQVLSFITSAADFVSVLGSAGAIALLVSRWRGKLNADIKWILMVLLLVTGFRHVSNFLEWTEITVLLDPFEDFVEILEPMLWLGLLYAFVQEFIRSDIQESEESYRTLVENIPGVVYRCEVNVPWAVEHITEGIYELTGQEAKNMVSGDVTLATLIHPDDLHNVAKLTSEGIASHRPFSLNYRLWHTDGTVRWVHERGVAIYDDRGNPQWLDGVIIDDTARKQAEESLMANEQKYRGLVENLRDHFFYIYGRDGVVSYVSPSIIDVLGYTRSEFMKDHLTYLTDSPINDIVDIKSRFAMRGLQQPSYEIEVKHADGSIHLLDMTEVPLFDADGLVMAVEGVARDITERRQAEEALRVSEERYRVFFNNSRDAFMTLEPPSWKFSSANPAMVAMFSAKNLSEMTSVGPWEVSPEFQPDGRASKEKAPEMIERAMTEGSHFFEWTHKRLDGQEFPATVLLSRVKLGDRELLQATVRDITERKKAEDAVLETQRKLSAIFEQGVIFTGLLDTDGKLIAANNTALKFIGCSEEDVLGKPFEETPWWVHSHELQHRLSQSIKQALDGESVRFEATHVSAAGQERIFDFTINPFRDESGRIRYLIPEGRDITELKRIQEKQLAIERKVQQAQKLESLGVLAGGVAHDFNNMLLAIMGNTDLALLDLPKDSPLRENLTEIKNTSQRAAGLAKQMLAYSGRGKFVLEQFDLSELVREMTRMLEVTVTPKASLECDLADDIPLIEADVTQIRQVIMNLIINASEAFGEDRGRISIKTVSKLFSCENLRQFSLGENMPTGLYAVLEVSDDGCGMDVETQAKLFDPFFTTKITGRGLGMAVVLGIIKGHAGAIKIQSTVGEGTTIQVLLPAVEVKSNVVNKN